MKRTGLITIVAGLFAIALNAQDATRGAALYKQQCASCHGERLEGRNGPPLEGAEFRARFTASGMADKIKNTMPQDTPGKLTGGEAADLAAYIQKTGQQATNAAPSAPPAAAPLSDFPASANLQQLMRGIMFPNSNIIFTVQTHDPAEKKRSNSGTADSGFNWAAWGNELYSGWDIVDYASLALAESAPLMLTPGRRCENGKPVPVNDPDWIRYTKEMAQVGRNAYQASQTRNQEKVSDISGDVAEACQHCHQVFRDKRRPGIAVGDPAAKQFRCTKN